MKQGNYLFATGAIREAEKRLISEDDMKRMIDAPDAEQSFKVFNDLSYSDELLEIQDFDRFADVLTHDLGQIKDFICVMATDRDLLKLLFAADDFHNLKILFKALLKGGIAENHSSLSFVDWEKQKKYVLENDRGVSLGRDYERIVNEAGADLEKIADPKEISAYFDKKQFAFMTELASRINDGRLKDIIGRQIDNANIKIAFRGHMLGWSANEVREKLIAGGQFDHPLLASCAELDENDIIDKLGSLILDRMTASDLENIKGKTDLWRLEKILDDQLIRTISEARIDPAGAAAVYAYYLGKLNEIKNISIIMTGKTNGIGAEEIKSRMRILY